MNAKDSLICLAEEILGILERGLHDPQNTNQIWGPALPKRVESAHFRLSSYEEISSFPTPRVGWSMTLGSMYSRETVDQFILAIQGTNDFERTLSSLKSDRKTDKGIQADLLYLTLYIYHVTKQLLAGVSPQIEHWAESFLKDTENRTYTAMIKTGMVGVSVSPVQVEVSPGAVLRRQKKSDYGDIDEPLNGRTYNQMSFPFAYQSPSILEISAVVDPSKEQGSGFQMFSYWSYTRIREFDSLINPFRRLSDKVTRTLTLVQSSSVPDVEFERIEMYLPNLSPNEPIYVWENRKYSYFTRGQIEISREDTETINLINSLLSANYELTIFRSGDEETPLSFAYHKYKEILDFYGEVEELIQRETMALESFFTPEHSTKKLFIDRISLLVSNLDIDENNTVNLLRNAYLVRGPFSHRGAGWDNTPTDRSLDVMSDDEQNVSISWHNYKVKLTGILKEYLRISIVSRILAGIDDRSYIMRLKKGNKNKTEIEFLKNQAVLFTKKIKKVNDYFQVEYSNELGLFPIYVNNLVEQKLVSPVILKVPGVKGVEKSVVLINESDLIGWRIELVAKWRNESQCAEWLRRMGYQAELMNASDCCLIYEVQKGSLGEGNFVVLLVMWRGRGSDQAKAAYFWDLDLDRRWENHLFFFYSENLGSYWIVPSEDLAAGLAEVGEICDENGKCRESKNTVLLSEISDGKVIPNVRFEEFRDAKGIDQLNKALGL